MKNSTKLLSKGKTNAKTAKNILETYILYMAPFNLNSKGINLCVNSTKGCILACLNTAGLGGVYPSIQQARIKKADYFVNDRLAFLIKLDRELFLLDNKAKKGGYKIEVRLNGTTDLDYFGLFKSKGMDILKYTNLIYYDYTAILGKALKYKDHPNYSVTFSRKENNEENCKKALFNRIHVAVVFDNKKPFPATYLGYKVIDGDKSDDIMIYETEPCILGLKAKGKAKKDITGFVVRNY